MSTAQPAGSQPAATVSEAEQAARYQKVRDTAATWIASADVKATALLTLAGTILALAGLAFAVATPRPSMVARGGVVVFAILDTVSVLAGFVALWPRTDRKCILRGAGVTAPSESSPTFFGDLAKLDFAGFTGKIATTTAEELANDSREQAMILCRVASAKMLAMRVAVAFVSGALAALAFAIAWAAIIE